MADEFRYLIQRNLCAIERAVLLPDSSDSEHQLGGPAGLLLVFAALQLFPICNDIPMFLFPTLKEWIALVCEFPGSLCCAWFACSG